MSGEKTRHEKMSREDMSGVSLPAGKSSPLAEVPPMGVTSPLAEDFFFGDFR